MDKLKESKFVADSAKFISAKAYLDAHFISSSSFSEGLVNTIYFDSLNLSSYDDKVDGQYLKYKFRLRFYGTQSDVFLEKKSKVGSIRKKNRLKVKVNPKELWLDQSYCSQFFQFFSQMIDVDSIEIYQDLIGLIPVL